MELLIHNEPPLIAAPSSMPVRHSKVRRAGKFLMAGTEKLSVRGATYGTFAPDASGCEFSDAAKVARDFRDMAENGFNAVRTYTVPPRWLLNCAAEHGLHLLIGIPWEQHITFLDQPVLCQAIEDRVRAAVRSCGGHPAILGFSIGNEIPSSIVRWHGKAAVEKFLRRLYCAAREVDAEALITYVNFPSTEYLDLPFLDFVAFNVYLERQADLEAYLSRLHNLVGDRPLLMAEVGLDSRRNGLDRQARVLSWQIQTALSSGCVGAFIFSWTDEWHRGGSEITDWDFGLTTRDREAKPALTTVKNAWREFSSPAHLHFSVVVCTHNGSKTLRDCCDGLLQLNYPHFEVIVVDDGSSDDSAAIAASYGFRVIRTPNQGLSSARNTGWQAARGEIVAYLDDDARPDPDWLLHLSLAFADSTIAGVGGPNIPPSGDGLVAEAVAHAPGGPMHVLLTDTDAEHIPGCNMAFRRAVLESLGGFDPNFRVAGDDVDFCWRVLQSGGRIHYQPGAMVWHHRRNSVALFWRQQSGYGRAEALLERKWPEHYNAAGHANWGGRIYGNGLSFVWGSRSRIYQGQWGSAPFQMAYPVQPPLLCLLPSMPEWYLILGFLAVLSGLAAFWDVLWPAPLLLSLGLVLTVMQAWISSRQIEGVSLPGLRADHWRLRWLVAALHILQPLARLNGRLRLGLTLWRNHDARRSLWPGPVELEAWEEEWRAPEERLSRLFAHLRKEGFFVQNGSDFDAWDLTVSTGRMGFIQVTMTTEEHGQGRQMIRWRLRPAAHCLPTLLLLGIGALAAGSIWQGAWAVAAFSGGLTVILSSRIWTQAATARAALLRSIRGRPAAG